MVDKQQCPETCRLQALMEGGISEDEQAEVASHLKDCEFCQAHFETLLHQSDVLSPGAKELVFREDQPETALQRAIEQLRKDQSAWQTGDQATVAAGEAAQSSEEDILLNLLEPSDEPQHLGRLGSYDIVELVGHGGMGVVLKGYEDRLNRCVAIKVLNPRLASNATARKRFHRESRAAAAVAHDHVVTIHAVDEINGLPILVMEYVEGTSLQKRIDAAGPLELEEILRVGMQTAQGLAAAHAQGLIHRDVKPSNILLENSVERVKLSDFGLARAVDDVQLTQTGVLAGTPEYMSPEQTRGETVDLRSDLFSLGCVLYAMCTGRSPFRAASTMAALRRVSDDTPRPIQEVNPGIPDWLVEIIDRLLAKDRDERFESAAEVAQLLGDHLAHLQQPSEVPQPARLSRLTSTASRKRRTWPGWRRSIIAAGLVILVLATGLGVTEGTGVTEIIPTVIEIWTPKGTLVLEIDDPRIEVTVKGNGEELTISGSGVHKLTLQLGEYKLISSKDDQPYEQQLVRITRGSEPVLKVFRKPPSPEDPVPRHRRPADAPPPDNEFTDLPDGRILFEPRNLPIVNSHFSERHPCSSPGGLALLFQSDRGNEAGDMDLWISTRTSLDALFRNPVNLSQPINSSYLDGDPAISADSLTLLFASRRPGGHGDWDIWMSTRASQTAPRGEPTNLGPIVNSRFMDASPALSPDGLTLVFKSDRPGGQGDTDLWMCMRASVKEPFGKAVNLGSTVNSSGCDGGPALAAGGPAMAADGFTLLFSSDRPGGQGGLDLWMCMRASSNQPFGVPFNLGPKVNSNSSDTCPNVSADGRWLLFASNRPGGQGREDLWMSRIGRRHRVRPPPTRTTNWPQFGFDGRNTGHNPHETRIDVSNVSKLRPLWTYNTGATSYANPVVVDGVVYHSDYSSWAVALDAETGRIIWRRPILGCSGGAAVERSIAYFASRHQGHMYAFKADSGEDIWNRPLDGTNHAPPIVHEGVVYVGTSMGTLYALDAKSGETIWTFSAEAKAKAPSLADGKVFFTSEDGNLYALEMPSGEKLWSVTLGQAPLTVAVENGLVYAGRKDGGICGFDLDSGKEVVSGALDGVSVFSPAVAEGKLYVGASDSKLYCFDAETGAQLWASDIDGLITGRPTVANGVVYAASRTGDVFLYAFDAETGEALLKYPLYSSQYHTGTTPIVVEGKVYMSATWGRALIALHVPPRASE